MKPADEVRTHADILKIIGDYVKLRKSGSYFKALCPFHQEKTPSFSVHPVKQIFHCFGCGASGDVFKFVMLIENVTFPEALERVAEKAGVPVPRAWKSGGEDRNAQQRAALYKMNETAARFFAAQLGATAEGRAARAYLTDREVSDEAIARFRLGYAPAGGGDIARRLAEEGFGPELVEVSGLTVPGREPGERPGGRFRRRVMFPLVSESGKTAGFAGRALTDEPPKYLNSPETPVYTKSRLLYHLHAAGPAIRKLDSAVLVEGYMDCIALASNGVENVVASCGTSLTEPQVRLLGRYARRIVVNYDPDPAGMAATERSLELLLEEGFEVRVLILPGGLDPDSFVRKNGGTAYLERLQKAVPYLDYLTERAAAAHNVQTPEGKVRAINAVLPHLAKVPSPLLRDELAGRLAARLRVDEKVLNGELRRAAQTGARELKAVAQPHSPSLQASLAEKELLRACLASPEIAAEVLPPLIDEGCCEGLATAQLLGKAAAELRDMGTLELSRLEELLSAEEYRYLVGVHFSDEEPPDRDSVSRAASALRRRKLERERAALQAAIERAEREQNVEELARLMRAKIQLIKGLNPPGGCEKSLSST
ncbi:MAG: DNA primase [Terriglobia bacterium]